jgi:hypothetical protein
MTNPEHFIIGEADTNAWGVSGIPFCALVDKLGKIVWTGHPASINLESKITELAGEGQPEDEASTLPRAQNKGDKF